MVFAGLSGIEAEDSILSFCAKFGGSPEVTEEGTIVYRFDDLMLRADSARFSQLYPPVKRLKTFSTNSKKMNGWFIAINAVNLVFGSYFLHLSSAAGLLVTELQYQSASYLYAFTHYFLQMVTADPVGIIRVVLGLVPLLFSVFFWLIPLARNILEKKENNDIKLSNYRRLGFNKIWSFPFNVDMNILVPSAGECRPKDLTSAGDRVIKDMGAVSTPEVKIADDGKTLFSFNELDNEKRALKKYREAIEPSRSQLGETVFDTELRIEK